MKLDISLGEKPLWSQLYDILLERIETGFYPVNQILPPELQLMDEFGVSRITVRQAMNKLMSDNLITRRRGKGTIVLPKKDKISTVFQSSFQGVKEDTDNFIFQLQWVKMVNAPLDVAMFFDIQEKDKVLCINRLGRNNKNEIVSEHISYISPKTGMNEQTDFTKSLYELYRKYDYEVESVNESITASIPTAIERKELEIGSRKMAIITRTRKGFHNNEKVEYTISKYLGEGYTLFINNI